MDLEYLRVGPEALRVERRQLADAGRPVERVADDLTALAADMEADGPAAHRDSARALLDRCLDETLRTESGAIETIRALDEVGVTWTSDVTGTSSTSPIPFLSTSTAQPIGVPPLLRTASTVSVP